MKKSFSLILASLLLAVSFASCGDTADTSSAPDTQSTVSGTTVSDEASEQVSEEEKFRIERQDFQGKEFIVYSTDDTDNFMSEIMPNDLSAGNTEFMTENVNLAIIERNRRVEEHLGITIKEMFVKSGRFNGEAMQEIRNNAMGNTLGVHLVALSVYDTGALTVQNTFVDLNSLDNFDSSASWWDQQFNDEVTVNNKLYFTQGALGIYGMNATSVVFFNKNAAREYGIPDLYSLVKDGEWTFDKIYELVKQYGNEDLDNNGVINYLDRAGYVGQYDDSWNFFYGSGEKIVDDNNGTLSLAMNTPRANDVIDRMNKMFRDRDNYVCANDYFGVSNTPLDLTAKMFTDGRALFFSDNLSFVHKFAVMEDDFGILPVPKYNKEQEKYMSLINCWSGNAFAIPAVLADDEVNFASLCLQTMAYYSVDTVKKEYIERTLKYQKTKDEESVDMLNLILDGRGVDLGFVYNVGSHGNTNNDTSLPWLLHALMTGTGTLASSYEAREGAAQADLDDVAAFYKD